MFRTAIRSSEAVNLDDLNYKYCDKGDDRCAYVTVTEDFTVEEESIGINLHECKYIS